MIRVTINDEPNIQEFITYFVKEKRTLRVQDNIYDYELKLSNIIKIEKQVKDLTIDEMTKLNAMLVKQRVTPYTFDNDNVAGQGLTQKAGKSTIKYVLDYNDTLYELEDYIDITNIVKGSVKEE